ncbi:amidohydrolase family protein [Catenuloplanes atrovinosus]|uniref:amidohydrolase family protein n=1 Tax=Catenuloplanes atrovinosus TaxID=137266 RepID=UPI0035B52C61
MIGRRVPGGSALRGHAPTRVRRPGRHPPHEAARAAATTPAALLGIAGRTGSVRPGKAAGLVVLNAGLRVDAAQRVAQQVLVGDGRGRRG